MNHNRNFFDLISTFAYEGSTGLWHILLWCFSFVIPITPDSVSIIHYIIILFFVWFFVFKIKLPTIFKILFLVQLSILWYSLSVRQYIMVPLFLVLFIYSVQQNKKWLSNLCIFLIVQVHVTAIPIGMSLWLYYIGLELINKKKILQLINILPVLGFLLAFIQLLPPHDLIDGLKEWKPVSLSSFVFANDNTLSEMLSTKHTWLYFCIILVFIAFLIRRSSYQGWKYLVVWILSFSTSYLFFVYISITKYLVIKHYQLLFFLLLTFLILVSSELKLRFHNIWYILLIPLLVYGAYKMKSKIADYYYAPFSYADQVAEFLDENYPDRTVLIKPETHYNSVRIYRKKETPVYALGRNDFTHYPVWNDPSIDHKINKRFLPVHLSDLRKDLANCPDSILKKKPLIVLGSEMLSVYKNDIGISDKTEILFNDELHLIHVKSFNGPALNYLTERFEIFEVTKATY